MNTDEHRLKASSANRPRSESLSLLPKTLRAVVFDHDGTLADSLDVVVTASNRILAEEGLPPRLKAEIVAGMVLPTPERLGALAGVSDRDRMLGMATRYDRHAVALAHLVKPYPGVAELLQRLHQASLPMAVVSNSAHVFLERALGSLGLLKFFPLLVGADDMPRPKPDPAGLLGAIEALGHPKGQAIYIGDSRTDLETARQAGVACVGVTWGAHSRTELESMGFDALVDHPVNLWEYFKE